MSEVMTLDVSAFEESAAWVKAQKMGSNYFHIKTTRKRLLPPIPLCSTGLADLRGNILTPLATKTTL